MPEDVSFAKPEAPEMERPDAGVTLREKIADFLRSVMPRDRWQLLFLAAVVCFTVAPRLSTIPAMDNPYTGWLLGLPANGRTEDLTKLKLILIVSKFAIAISSVFGYFNLFFAGGRAGRRILWTMVLPVSLGLAGVTGSYLYMEGKIPLSVLAPHPWVSLGAATIWQTMRELGPGFRVGAAGLALLLVFLSRVAFGIATLPLRLAEPNCAASSEVISTKRMQFLFVLCVSPAIGIATGLLLLSLSIGSTRLSNWALVFSLLLSGAFTFVPIALVLGVGEYLPVFRVSRPFRWGYAGYGVTLAAGVFFVAGLLGYVVERAEWGATAFSRFDPPSFWGETHIPHWTALCFILPAIAEESLFRGIFQKRFIGSYGMWRGVFLAQLAWGASHFYSDNYSYMDYAAIVISVISRVALCLAWGFVLAWLTFKSGTIWAAAAAHSVHNVLLSTGFTSEVPARAIVFAVAYGIAAIWLYRERPVTKEEVEVSPPRSGGGEMVVVGSAER